MNKKKLSILTLIILLASIILPVFATEPTTKDYVVEMDGVQYESIAEALKNVPKDNTSKTITLIKEDLDAPGFKTEDGQNVVIDFNGKTYNVTEPLVGSTGTETLASQLLRGSTVTLKNGTFSSLTAAMLVQNYSNLTVTDMMLNTENGVAQYVLSNNSGKVLVNGTTSIKVNPSLESGKASYAMDMCWAPKNGYPEGTQITINTTGTVKGNIELGIWGAYEENPKSTLTIENINHDGKFVINEKLKNQLTVKGGCFKDLANAISAIPADGVERTIKLYSNVTDGAGFKIEKGQNVVIDFNGKTYNVTEPLVGSTGTETLASQLLRGSTVTLKNGTFSSLTAAMLVQNYSNLTVTDMMLNTENGVAQYVLSNNSGKVLVNGTTSIKVNPSLESGKASYAMDMCWAPKNGYPEGTQITINTTGTVKGNIELGIWGAYEENPKSTLTIENINHDGKFVINEKLENQLSIKGGRFLEEIKDKYLVSNYVCELNEESSFYEVRKREVESTLPNISEDSSKIQTGIADINKTEVNKVLKDSLGAIEEGSELAKDIENKDVTVEIEITNDNKEEIEEIIIEKIENALKQIAEDIKTSEFFDITIAIKTEDGTVGNLSELKEEIPITISLPENLRNAPNGYTRKFYVARHHIEEDGTEKVEILNATKSEDGKSIVILSSKFSTYAIAYADEKDETQNNTQENGQGNTQSGTQGNASGGAQENVQQPTQNNDAQTNNPVASAPATNNTTNTTSNPATGDNIVVYVITFVIAIVGMLTIVVIKKKNNTMKH